MLKLQEGRPNIVDAIENKKIQLVFNVPVGRRGKEDDSYIRKAAIWSTRKHPSGANQL
jgi:carbamoyl-phosphate synthase large subunit